MYLCARQDDKNLPPTSNPIPECFTSQNTRQKGPDIMNGQGKNALIVTPLGLPGPTVSPVRYVFWEGRPGLMVL